MSNTAKYAALMITAAMIADAKEKYGDDKVKRASLPLDDSGEAYLDVLITVPSRKIIGEFEKWSDKNPDKAKEILVKNCLLTFKDEVLADEELFFSAVGAIAEIIPVRKAIIKNC